MLTSNLLVLFRNLENTSVIFLRMYTSLGFEFVKERNDTMYN